MNNNGSTECVISFPGRVRFSGIMLGDVFSGIQIGVKLLASLARVFNTRLTRL